MIYASNKNTPGVLYGYGGFRDSVDMGILWRFPQVFLMGMDIKIQSPRQPCMLYWGSIFQDFVRTSRAAVWTEQLHDV